MQMFVRGLFLIRLSQKDLKLIDGLRKSIYFCDGPIK